MDFLHHYCFTTFRYGAVLSMVAHHRGNLAALPKLPMLEQLRSFKCAQLRVQLGEEVAPTLDALGSPGSVELVASTREVLLKNDIEK